MPLSGPVSYAGRADFFANRIKEAVSVSNTSHFYTSRHSASEP